MAYTAQVDPLEDELLASNPTSTRQTRPRVQAPAPAPSPYTQEYYRQNDPGVIPGVTPADPATPVKAAPPTDPADQKYSGGLSREQWRDKWLGAGQMTSQAMDAWMAANGATKMGENGTFRTPFGEVLDLGIGYKTGTVTPGWTRTDGGGAGGGAGAGGAGGAGAAGNIPGGMGDAIRRLLLRGEDPVDAEDVNAQYLPVRNAMERQAQLTRAQMAQRGAVQGTNVAGGGGALEGDVASLGEDLATRQGTIMAELIGDEISARRQDVQAAIQFAQGEERMALQRELADLDRQMQALQLSQQNQQFYDRFAWDVARYNEDGDSLEDI